MKIATKIALSLTLIGITACSSKSNDIPKLDYQSENNRIVSLEVPPDLNDPRNGDLYQLPQGVHADPNALKVENRNTVLAQVKGVHIERQGNQRWLVIDNKKASEIWPILRAFWLDSGFTIYSEEPRIGLMETDWAENRAKLPNQGLRRLFDKVGIGGLYTTSERDKFIIRIEHNKQGGLDIFFTHKGLEEVYSNKDKDSTVWQPRPNDPNLEAAFLARFMQYLGADEETINHQLEAHSTKQQTNQFAQRETNSVLVYGSVERNLNRIGAALDRIGLTVEQFVSERGIFVVRPAQDESDELRQANKKPGFFGRLFGKKAEQSTEVTKAPQMFIQLENTGNGQRIHLLDQLGRPYQGENAQKWLDQIYDELK